jgi:hypothetical protein
VKRIRMFIVLAMVAAAVTLLPALAGATGTTPAPNQVTIQSNADYDFVGGMIDVGLYVRCTGGSGDVIVSLNQYPPETPYPVGVGSGPQIVVCDGKTHSVGVSVPGFGFDAGKAWATADLTTASGGSAHAARWINIIVV